MIWCSAAQHHSGAFKNVNKLLLSQSGTQNKSTTICDYLFYIGANMKALIQRVTRAQVTVGEELVSSIGKGLCVLVGICRDDTPKDMEYIVRKILNTRLFDDEAGKRWNSSVKDKNLEILCVSQFTLYHELKGNKPDFHNAMGADTSQTFYSDFLNQLKGQYSADRVKDGKFGAYMQVDIQNDGPVTLMIESPKTK